MRKHSPESIISPIFNKKIGADDFYVDSLKWTNSMYSINEQLYTKNFTGFNDMVLIREAIINKPFKLYQILFKLSYNPIQILSSLGYSKIYDCGSVSGFDKT